MLAEARGGGSDGLRGDELTSDQWVPFAGQDSDTLAICCVSGRVFDVPHDDEPRLIADSLVSWFERYAAEVLAGDFRVEPGFGDYFLSRRDRKREERERERAEREASRERYERETPILEQLKQAVGKGNSDAARDVFLHIEKNNAGELPQAVSALFGATTDPKFVAGALQHVLNAVTLNAEQWALVAKGGELLGNNAIRDLAVARAPKPRGFFARLFGAE